MRGYSLNSGLILLAAALSLGSNSYAQEGVTPAPAAALAQGQETVPPTGSEQQQAPSVLLDSLPEVPEGTTEEEAAALRMVDQILREQQMLLSGQNFVYQAEGRRDPFRSLIRARQRELAAPLQRPAGLPGFLINEVTVNAVAEYQGRWHAMMIGIDRRTYFAQVGSELYDGRIVEINGSEVVFEQEVEDLLGARSTRRVVKRLRGEEG